MKTKRCNLEEPPYGACHFNVGTLALQNTYFKP